MTPVPAFLLRLAMGEMADVVLNSTRVSANKVIKAGYTFLFPELEETLRDLVERRV